MFRSLDEFHAELAETEERMKAIVAEVVAEAPESPDGYLEAVSKRRCEQEIGAERMERYFLSRVFHDKLATWKEHHLEEADDA